MSECGYKGNDCNQDFDSFVFEFLLVFIIYALLGLQTAGWVAIALFAWRVYRIK